MKTLIDYLREIKNATGENIQPLLMEVWKNHENIFSGIQMSLDPTPIKASRVPSVEGDDNDSEISFLDFANLYNLLISESISEKEANELICEMALMASIVEWNEFYRPILLKTLHKKVPIEHILKFLGDLTTE